MLPVARPRFYPITLLNWIGAKLSSRLTLLQPQPGPHQHQHLLLLLQHLQSLPDLKRFAYLY